MSCGYASKENTGLIAMTNLGRKISGYKEGFGFTTTSVKKPVVVQPLATTSRLYRTVTGLLPALVKLSVILEPGVNVDPADNVPPVTEP